MSQQPEITGYATLTRPTILRELDGLMQALCAGDQAQAQNNLLVEVLGLGDGVNE